MIGSRHFGLNGILVFCWALISPPLRGFLLPTNISFLLWTNISSLVPTNISYRRISKMVSCSGQMLDCAPPSLQDEQNENVSNVNITNVFNVFAFNIAKELQYHLKCKFVLQKQEHFHWKSSSKSFYFQKWSNTYFS